MRRTIEDLIAQRKKSQENLVLSLGELAGILGKKGFFRKDTGEIAAALKKVHADLDAWVTVQDREWDAYASNHATTVFKSLQWKIEKLEAEYSLVKTLLANFIQLEGALSDLIERIDSKSDDKDKDKLRAIRDQLSVFQYSGFEERFRGSPAAVRAKLGKYLPYFAGAHRVLDLGCGRGEFLELLREQGNPGFGVDVSDSMLNQAREKGLDVRRQDALAALREAADGTLGGILSTQTIEHFPAEYLRHVVRESFRVLKSGACLVMETINPLSLFALSRIYHLDPAHEKPLHPEYMRYLLESAGFTAVEILFAADAQAEKLEEIGPDQPNALAFNRNVDRLNELLFAAPEYAAIGKKP